jgi:hypothetical protein
MDGTWFLVGQQPPRAILEVLESAILVTQSLLVSRIQESVVVRHSIVILCRVSERIKSGLLVTLLTHC